MRSSSFLQYVLICLCLKIWHCTVVKSVGVVLVNTGFPSYVSTTVVLVPNVGRLRHRGVVVAEIAVVNKKRRVEHRMMMLQRSWNFLVCEMMIVHAISREKL